MIKRALISVTDKTGVVEFARMLLALGFEIVSTGGTAREINRFGLPVKLIEEVTGFPEMLDGRVKTLHPMIFAGIIADQNNPKHLEKLAEYSIVPFGLVVANLYKFAEDPSVENIDVGGPSMIRAAAKNYGSVGVVVYPSDYDDVLAEMKHSGKLSELTRFKLATKAFQVTAIYDTMIAKEYDSCLRQGLRLKSGTKH